MTAAMKMILGSFAACLALGAMADAPAISDVVARQRWPWSRLVDIDYVLTCDSTQRVDVVLAAKDGSDTLTLPTESLSGDLYGVTHGPRRIIWDPTKTAYTNSQMLTQFSVTLTPTPAPLYMIVDLTKTAGAEGEIEYLYPDDARLVTEGRFTNVWFGVTNDSAYATDKLVLRRVPAGSFMMGPEDVPANTQSVMLTKDFYVSIFEVTETQWAKIMGGTLSAKPKVSVPYNLIRGATNDTPAVNWYTTGADVCPTSFIGRLRAKTGIGDFDLPTEAQWEYLCRAGTTTYFNDGLPGSSTNQLNALAWWTGNCVAMQPVGQKLPNLWGLYDTHGNAWEWVLDWYSATLPSGTNPPGSAAGTTRMKRSGSCSDPAVNNRSAARHSSGTDPAASSTLTGFRLIRNLQ